MGDILLFSLFSYTFSFPIVNVLNTLKSLLLIHKTILLPGNTIYKTSNGIYQTQIFMENPL